MPSGLDYHITGLIHLDDLIRRTHAQGNHDNMLMRDIVNAYQTEYIMEIAEKGPCVIVGRNADYILENRENCLNVFIHAILPIGPSECSYMVGK